MDASMPQRAALELVSSNRNRIASRSAGVAYLDALRQLPRAVSVVTFERGSAARDGSDPAQAADSTRARIRRKQTAIKSA